MACTPRWGHRASGLVALALGTVVAASCVSGAPPAIESVGDQVAAVGTELRLELRTSDPDGDPVDVSVAADLGDLADRATLGRAPGGAAVFRWTPRAGDVGVWHLDFTASDGDHATVLTVRVDVRAAVGDRSAPRFRAPLGAGTTLDLATDDCVDLAIAIDDQDSVEVALREQEPRIEGATLAATGGLTGVWHWCPTAAQVAADDRYTLTLAADDLTNEPVVKSYLIVLRSPPAAGCTGDPPVVHHAPADATTDVDLTVDARITDDRGLLRPPLLYTATDAPATPPDLAAMSPIEMVLIDGDLADGTWAADVPNPAAPGASAPLYYAVVARDDDDPAGACDHTTQAPARGTYAMRVTRPTPACADDGHENNDSASGARAIAPGALDAVSCPLATDPDPVAPDDDEDWFALTIPAPSQVTVDIAGSDVTDVDLALVDSAGLTIVGDSSTASVAQVSACLRTGTYYARVHAYGRGRNPYRLRYVRAPSLCLR
jgi:hypothetical protein